MIVSVLCGPDPSSCSAERFSTVLQVFGQHKVLTATDILQHLLGHHSSENRSNVLGNTANGTYKDVETALDREMKDRMSEPDKSIPVCEGDGAASAECLLLASARLFPVMTRSELLDFLHSLQKSGDHQECHQLAHENDFVFSSAARERALSQVKFEVMNCQARRDDDAESVRSVASYAHETTAAGFALVHFLSARDAARFADHVFVAERGTHSLSTNTLTVGEAFSVPQWLPSTDAMERERRKIDVEGAVSSRRRRRGDFENGDDHDDYDDDDDDDDDDGEVDDADLFYYSHVVPTFKSNDSIEFCLSSRQDTRACHVPFYSLLRTVGVNRLERKKRSSRGQRDAEGDAESDGKGSSSADARFSSSSSAVNASEGRSSTTDGSSVAIRVQSQSGDFCDFGGEKAACGDEDEEGQWKEDCVKGEDDAAVLMTKVEKRREEACDVHNRSSSSSFKKRRCEEMHYQEEEMMMGRAALGAGEGVDANGVEDAECSSGMNDGKSAAESVAATADINVPSGFTLIGSSVPCAHVFENESTTQLIFNNHNRDSKHHQNPFSHPHTSSQKQNTTFSAVDGRSRASTPVVIDSHYWQKTLKFLPTEIVISSFDAHWVLPLVHFLMERWRDIYRRAFPDGVHAEVGAEVGGGVDRTQHLLFGYNVRAIMRRRSNALSRNCTDDEDDDSVCDSSYGEADSRLSERGADDFDGDDGDAMRHEHTDTSPSFCVSVSITFSHPLAVLLLYDGVLQRIGMRLSSPSLSSSLSSAERICVVGVSVDGGDGVGSPCPHSHQAFNHLQALVASSNTEMLCNDSSDRVKGLRVAFGFGGGGAGGGWGGGGAGCALGACSTSDRSDTDDGCRRRSRQHRSRASRKLSFERMLMLNVTSRSESSACWKGQPTVPPSSCHVDTDSSQPEENHDAVFDSVDSAVKARKGIAERHAVKRDHHRDPFASFITSLRSRSPTPPRVHLKGVRVGPFRLTRRLGKGNNAVVMMGENIEPPTGDRHPVQNISREDIHRSGMSSSSQEQNDFEKVAVKVLFEHSDHALAEVTTLAVAQKSRHTPRMFGQYRLTVPSFSARGKRNAMGTSTQKGNASKFGSKRSREDENEDHFGKVHCDGVLEEEEEARGSSDHCDSAGIEVQAVAMELLGMDLFDLAHQGEDEEVNEEVSGAKEEKDGDAPSLELRASSFSSSPPSLPSLSYPQRLSLILGMLDALVTFHKETRMVHGSVKLENFCVPKEMALPKEFAKSSAEQNVQRMKKSHRPSDEALTFAAKHHQELLSYLQQSSYHCNTHNHCSAPIDSKYYLRLLDYGRARPITADMREEPFTGWWYSDWAMMGIPLRPVDDLVSLLHASTYMILAGIRPRRQPAASHDSACIAFSFSDALDVYSDALSPPSRQFVACRKARLEEISDLREALLTGHRRRVNYVALKRRRVGNTAANEITHRASQNIHLGLLPSSSSPSFMFSFPPTSPPPQQPTRNDAANDATRRYTSYIADTPLFEALKGVPFQISEIEAHTLSTTQHSRRSQLSEQRCAVNPTATTTVVPAGLAASSVSREEVLGVATAPPTPLTLDPHLPQCTPQWLHALSKDVHALVSPASVSEWKGCSSTTRSNNLSNSAPRSDVARAVQNSALYDSVAEAIRIAVTTELLRCTSPIQGEGKGQEGSARQERTSNLK